MKTRAEIKAQAKSVLKANYGMSLAPSLIFMAVTAIASTVTMGIGSILIMPISVGLCLVYLMLYRSENPPLELMFTSAIQENYLRKLIGMLLVSIYTALWSLLFVIPGIVKSYSYALTPYILAKYPGIDAQRAITLSRRLMDGRKMDLFIVDLSFIGWYLLGTITFGLSLILHTTPYIMLTKSGFFDEVLSDAIANGRISESELNVNG